MNKSFVQYEVTDRVATLTICRPEVLNAIHPPCWDEMTEAVATFTADASAWVLILTGSGERAFSVGADLKHKAASGQAPPIGQRPVDRFIASVGACDKPVIAAVRGYAVGGGMELALCADIILAADDAKFGLPEPRRGLIADTGGVLRLPQRLPYHAAMSLLLTGRFINAAEALRLGLVAEVVEARELIATAQRWAREITTCSPAAVQAVKAAARSACGDLTPDDLRALDELAPVQRLRQSADHREGPRAFAEKRPPRWADPE